MQRYCKMGRDVPISFFTDIPITDAYKMLEQRKHNRSNITSKSI